jgi:hypothetical protein
VIRLPGYARRKGVLADIRRLTPTLVIGNRHSNGEPVRWPRGECELLEFGSFNPANPNYQRGGKPWKP